MHSLIPRLILFTIGIPHSFVIHKILPKIKFRLSNRRRRFYSTSNRSLTSLYVTFIRHFWTTFIRRFLVSDSVLENVLRLTIILVGLSRESNRIKARKSILRGVIFEKRNERLKYAWIDKERIVSDGYESFSNNSLI